MHALLRPVALMLLGSIGSSAQQQRNLPHVQIDAMYAEPIDPVSLLCKRTWTLDRAVIPSSPPTKSGSSDAAVPGGTSDILFLPNGTCRFQSGEVGTWTCRAYPNGRTAVGLHIDPPPAAPTKKSRNQGVEVGPRSSGNPLEVENARRKMAQAKRAAEADPKKRRLEEAEGMVELEIEVMEGARRRRRRSVDTVEDGEEEEKMRPVVVYNIPLGRGFLNPTVARFGRGTIHWLPRPDALKSAAIGECRVGIRQGLLPRKVDRIW
eukprot:CAMPEP_0113306876 /NCGR_PEP_ID=MMETSP0010_2-20120614/5954_1 /TAXON_ID=216773 ORGANISM="Corethron hystrix, Strain 308" /NCGR_SAMPLE_ID=MMETSP0010_2 /ASSEMBLY_ACC=CAM_ASM_000155 /LENGTH=263 /DNA_ID=CAMNT_0000161635 /DNA_START=151 /DNA_END=939 /DNA_ORIENTATION=- /assembly_acc=CAM_ASM_000155